MVLVGGPAKGSDSEKNVCDICDLCSIPGRMQIAAKEAQDSRFPAGDTRRCEKFPSCRTVS